MRFDIFGWTDDRGFRYVKAFAVLTEKDGAHRRHQKTWKARTVAPDLSAVEMRSSFEAEAKRWAAKIIQPLKT